MVYAVNIQDKVSIRWLLRRVPFTARWQRRVVEGSDDTDANAHWCADWFGIAYEVVYRLPGSGFVVQPRRWVVERTFAWFGNYRRLSEDFIDVASIHCGRGKNSFSPNLAQSDITATQWGNEV